MKEVGIRELKAHASQILRTLRKRRERYIVTYRGKPMAILAPLEPDERGTPGPGAMESPWQELIQLGHEIGMGWTAPVTSAELLSAMRR